MTETIRVWTSLIGTKDVSVDARFGDWVIHRNVSSFAGRFRQYSVTHAPTGLTAYDGLKRECVELAKRFHATGLRYTPRQTSKPIRRLPKRVEGPWSQICREFLEKG